ncbi:hypothetical protein CBR_g48474 [Chara braunii]|uniref:Uncharacterized protein n=1 Tax=Chara braunii TaxID=69332 RepID=A0A388M2Z6_CHABU|nr:hypothetical protein CBR_g48474 [Chara braunii]|eukprot:GBG88862.1 hypothetical protein CBR_g48474 [Chara braunii]
MNEPELYEWNEALKFKLFLIQVIKVPVSVLPHLRGAVGKAYGKVLRAAPAYADPISPDLWNVRFEPISPDLWNVRFDLVPSARVSYKRTLIIDMEEYGYVELDVACADFQWCKACKHFFHEENDPICPFAIKKGKSVDPNLKQKQGYKEALMKSKEKADHSEDKDIEQRKTKDKEGERSVKPTSSDEPKGNNSGTSRLRGLKGKGKRIKSRTEKGHPTQKWKAAGKAKKGGEKEEEGLPRLDDQKKEVGRSQTEGTEKVEGDKEEEGLPGLNDQKKEVDRSQTEGTEKEEGDKEDVLKQNSEEGNEKRGKFLKSPLVTTLSKDAAKILEDCVKKIAEAKMGFPEKGEVPGVTQEPLSEPPSAEPIPNIGTDHNEVHDEDPKQDIKIDDMEVVEAAEILFKARTTREKQVLRKEKKALLNNGKRQAG